MLPNQISIEIPESIFESWQDIVNIVAKIASVPAALIMRIEDKFINVLVSSQSKDNPYITGHKEVLDGSGLYCEYVVKSSEKLLVPNALKDKNWKDNPDIGLGMISYLGFPIMSPNKQPYGTICILDIKENPHSRDIEMLMLKFRDLIESNLEIIFMNQILGDKNRRLSDYLNEIQVLRGIVPICSGCKSVRIDDAWQPIENFLVNHPEAQFSHGLCPDCLKKLYPEYADSILKSDESNKKNIIP